MRDRKRQWGNSAAVFSLIEELFNRGKFGTTFSSERLRWQRKGDNQEGAHEHKAEAKALFRVKSCWKSPLKWISRSGIISSPNQWWKRNVFPFYKISLNSSREEVGVCEVQVRHGEEEVPFRREARSAPSGSAWAENFREKGYLLFIQSISNLDSLDLVPWAIF